MPRHDGNTPESPRRHHAPMRSGRKGRGHDKKLRAVKKMTAESCGHCRKPLRNTRKQKELSSGVA